AVKASLAVADPDLGAAARLLRGRAKKAEFSTDVAIRLLLLAQVLLVLRVRLGLRVRVDFKFVFGHGFGHGFSFPRRECARGLLRWPLPFLVFVGANWITPNRARKRRGAGRREAPPANARASSRLSARAVLRKPR